MPKRRKLKYSVGDVAAQEALEVQAPPVFVCACHQENRVSEAGLKRLRDQVPLGETRNIKYRQECWYCHWVSNLQISRTVDDNGKEKIDVQVQLHPGD